MKGLRAMRKLISDRFIEICRAVTADGVVNADELHYLATWLNENPKAMKCWPGALFVEPLNRFFADGRIDTTEIEAATILLRQVEKEYAESKTKGQQRTDRESPSSAFSGEDNHALTSNQSAHTLTLPVVNWKGKSLASSIRGFYDVELATPIAHVPIFVVDVPASQRPIQQELVSIL